MSLFTDERTPTILLLRTLTAKYGVGWMGWAPSVLRKTLEKDADGISKINLNKALAGAVVATRDSFWESGGTFLFLAQGLNGMIPIADTMPELSVGEMMIAVDVAEHIRKDLGGLVPAPKFSEEVAKTIAAQALNNGVWYLPKPLDFASDYAAGRSYRCKSCGNIGPAEHDFDGICDACSGRFEMGGASQLTSWKPDPRFVAEAKKTEVFEKNPTDKVKKRLAEVLGGKDVVLQENADDACVARLLVALHKLEQYQDSVKHAEAA